MTADARRASLIEATLPLLREKGREASTKEIAKAAGVAEGTIFRVFANKDELILACIHDAFDNTAMRRGLQAVDMGLPLAKRLEAGVQVMQDHLLGIFSLMAVLQSSGQRLHPPRGREAARERARATAEVEADFAALFGDEADQLRMPVKQVVEYLRMLTLSSVHPMLDAKTSSPAELVDVVLNGALVHPPSDTPADRTPGGKR